MLEDRTGWEVIFDGTDRGAWGRYLLPMREQRQSDVWVTPVQRRRYNKTGKFAAKEPHRGGGGMEDGHGFE